MIWFSSLLNKLIWMNAACFFELIPKIFQKPLAKQRMLFDWNNDHLLRYYSHRWNPLNSFCCPIIEHCHWIICGQISGWYHCFQCIKVTTINVNPIVNLSCYDRDSASFFHLHCDVMVVTTWVKASISAVQWRPPRHLADCVIRVWAGRNCH